MNVPNSSEPSVAVLLASYNGERYIAQQISSILGQSHRNLTLFIRDDLSTDGTRNVVANLAKSDSRIVVLESTHATGAAACNFFTMLCAVKVEDFDYVAFADQDDIWMPEKLQRAIGCLADSGAAGYSCDLIAFDNTSRACWYIVKSQEPRPFDYIFQGGSAGCTYVITSDAAAKIAQTMRPLVPDLPKSNSHDWIIYAYIRSRGLGWYADKDPYIFYRQHTNNAYGDQQGLSKIFAKLKLFKSSWYRDHICWNKRILSQNASELRIINRIENPTFSSRLYLALRSAEFRRTRKERVILAALLLVNAF